MAYYTLDIDSLFLNVFLEEEPETDVGRLLTGRALPADEEIVFRWQMRVDDEAAEPSMFDFFPRECLMSKRFVKCLQAAGVDNLQLFPSVLTDSATGQQIHDYLAVNVVGLVACADMEKSNAVPLADVHYFHDLVIDESKASPLKLFRLAEQQTVVVVDEAVAKAIEEGGFEDIELTPATAE